MAKYFISGTLLACIIDEAMTANQNSVGYLFGSRTSKNIVSTTDIDETISSQMNSIHITGFENMRRPMAFWENQGIMSAPIDSEKGLVGSLVIRRDGVINPSFRDVRVACQLIQQINTSNGEFPFLILAISIPSGQKSWIFGINHALYAIQDPGTPIVTPIDLTICSLQNDSASEYDTSEGLSKELHVVGDSSSVFMQRKISLASSAICRNVEIELFSDSILEDIKVSVAELMEIEAEVDCFRKQLAQLSVTGNT